MTPRPLSALARTLSQRWGAFLGRRDVSSRPESPSQGAPSRAAEDANPPCHAAPRPLGVIHGDYPGGAFVYLRPRRRPARVLA